MNKIFGYSITSLILITLFLIGVVSINNSIINDIFKLFSYLLSFIWGCLYTSVDYTGWNIQWYNEYNSSIRIHDYVSVMINQFPLLVIRKYDSPQDNRDFVISIGFFGFTFDYTKKYDN